MLQVPQYLDITIPQLPGASCLLVRLLANGRWRKALLALGFCSCHFVFQARASLPIPSLFAPSNLQDVSPLQLLSQKESLSKNPLTLGGFSPIFFKIRPSALGFAMD